MTDPKRPEPQPTRPTDRPNTPQQYPDQQRRPAEDPKPDR